MQEDEQAHSLSEAAQLMSQPEGSATLDWQAGDKAQHAQKEKQPLDLQGGVLMQEQEHKRATSRKMYRWH